MNGALRPLFFTGGSALANLSRELARQNLPSFHIITTFDSGGSTAELRRVYAMPAVGDMRNRLLALASPQTPGPVLDFCALRLAKNGNIGDLRDRLWAISEVDNLVWHKMPDIYAAILRQNLGYFLKRMKPDFDPRGACIGNLLLAGSYLESGRRFPPMLATFGSLLRCVGVARPVVEGNYYLGARLANGEALIGQHLFRNLPAPVNELFLSVNEQVENMVSLEGCRPPLASRAKKLLSEANLICFPMGSFYSSLLANLLPRGVGKSVAACRGAKVFIPNTGHDPELHDLDLVGQARLILKYLRQDAPRAGDEDLLNIILIDGENGQYPGGVGESIKRRLKKMGLRIINRPVVYPHNPNMHDPARLLNALREVASHV